MPLLGDLLETIGGDIQPPRRALSLAQSALGRIVTDSRQIEPGDVFWALRGLRYDGAFFVNEAFRRGASGAVVDCAVEVPHSHWIIQVDDTQRALEQWAAWKRRQFSGTLIAVTGSVGKTTTRQMIHTVLQTRLCGTASPRNFNNHVGVPLSMLDIAPHHDYAVLELGASKPGEIAALAALCQPKVGVITQIGEAHLAGFGSRQAIADAKSELLAAIPECGQAVLADDSWLHNAARRCTAPITWIGPGPQCTYRALDIANENGRLTFHVACADITMQPAPFSIPVYGRHHLTAALAAIAVGRMLGFDWHAIATALEEFKSVPMRCEVLEIRGATIINDAYNSSPTAMRAALELLRDFDASGRRIVICGDMAELGQESQTLHWHLGKEIVTIGGAELLIACGQFARHITAGARAAGMVRSRAIPCNSIDEAMAYVGQAILPGDIALVKGSRSMGMERVIEALQRYPQRRLA